MSWKKSWFSPWPSCLSGLISTFCIADRIYLFGGFLSGITVWKADPRTGGRTPDRRQPTGAMQAWIGDGQHEQRQVLGGLLLGAGLCAARGRTLWCLSSPYKRGSGLRTLSQVLESWPTWFKMFKRCLRWFVLESLFTKWTLALNANCVSFYRKRTLCI